jgi:hypothetical protein
MEIRTQLRFVNGNRRDNVNCMLFYSVPVLYRQYIRFSKRRIKFLLNLKIQTTITIN